eukprot:9801560-Alexandrium_andersonii.AAC.1
MAKLMVATPRVAMIQQWGMWIWVDEASASASARSPRRCPNSEASAEGPDRLSWSRVSPYPRAYPPHT